jgi:hypothetical protein
MLQQITDLIQFLSSSSSNIQNENYKVGISGLFLPEIYHTNTQESIQQRAVRNDITIHGSGGGMAVLCPDRTSFVNIDTMFAMVRNSEYIGCTTTTKSGICIPSLQNDIDSTRSPTFATALVLPLDVTIWETAYNVRSMQQHDESE